jgi:hypothetical protein
VNTVILVRKKVKKTISLTAGRRKKNVMRREQKRDTQKRGENPNSTVHFDPNGDTCIVFVLRLPSIVPYFLRFVRF